MSTILAPFITEKSSEQNEENRYCFLVAKQANKLTIKKEIKRIYGATVEEVKTLRCPGRAVIRHTKKGVVRGRRRPWKKAFVYVRRGDSIDVHAETL